MAEGQRLRWWKEEKQATEVVRTSVLLESHESASDSQDILTEHRDVGEELEAEARRRAQALTSASPGALVFSTDVRRARKLLNRRTAVSLRLLLVSIGLQSVSTAILVILLWRGGPMAGWRFGLTLGIAIINLLVVSISLLSIRYLRRYETGAEPPKPVLKVFENGVDVSMPRLSVGEIPWRYIADVRTEKVPFSKDSYNLVLELRDFDSFVLGRGDKEARTLREYVSKLVVLHGRACPPAIHIPDYLLPLPVQEIVARIAAYEAAKGG